MQRTTKVKVGCEVLCETVVAVYYWELTSVLLETKQYCSVYYWELTSVRWGRSNIVMFILENSLQSFGDEAVLFCLLLKTHFGPLGTKQYCSIYYWELTSVLWGWSSIVLFTIENLLRSFGGRGSIVLLMMRDFGRVVHGWVCVVWDFGVWIDVLYSLDRKSVV